MSHRVEYREFPVPGGLRRHVRCLWHLRVPASPDRIDTVYPDGCCEVIVHRLAPMHAYDAKFGWRQQARSIFAAQQRSAIRLTARGDGDCLGIRLQPAASALLAGQRLPDLRDRIVELTSLDAGFATRFVEEASVSDVAQALANSVELLETRLCPVDSRIEKAVVILDAIDGLVPVATLAAACGMSLRAFQNRFRDCVGLGAKEFARIRRLQATIRLLDAGADTMAHLAAATGFADQAHASREVRRVTGSTPARLREALRSNRDGESSVRLAAAFVRGQRLP